MSSRAPAVRSWITNALRQSHPPARAQVCTQPVITAGRATVKLAAWPPLWHRSAKLRTSALNKPKIQFPSVHVRAERVGLRGWSTSSSDFRRHSPNRISERDIGLSAWLGWGCFVVVVGLGGSSRSPCARGGANGAIGQVFLAGQDHAHRGLTRHQQDISYIHGSLVLDCQPHRLQGLNAPVATLPRVRPQPTESRRGVSVNHSSGARPPVLRRR